MTDHYSSASDYAAIGWQICAVKGKQPIGARWQLAARDPEYWADHPDHGIGLIHGLSGTCALDLDDFAASRVHLAKEGVDLDTLMLSGLQIISPVANRAKLLYKLPAGEEFRRVVGGGGAYELRGGATQDVLPPSAHPAGGRYAWGGDPMDDIPPLPPCLIRLWRRHMTPARIPAHAPARIYSAGDTIITRFNADADVGKLLESFGYEPRGARWIAPASKSRDPGVVLLPDSGRVYSHHASDPLADGYSHDPFSVFCVLAHGGDATAATREAAAWYGEDADPDTTAQIEAWAETWTQPPPTPPASSPRDPGPIPVSAVASLARQLSSAGRAKQGAVRHAALAVAAAAAMRRYVTPDGEPCALFLGVTDTSTAQHRALKPAMYEILAAAGDREIVRGTEFSSSAQVYRHFMRSPRCLWVTDTLAHMIAMSRRQQSGAIESALSAISERYHGSTLFLDPDTAGSTKDRALSDCDIPDAVMTLFVMFPADLLSALAQRGEYGRGTIQQLILAPAGAPCTDATPGHEVAQATIAMMTQGEISQSAGLRPEPRRVQWGHGAEVIMRMHRDRMIAMMDTDGARQWRGMAHGYSGAAVRLASILAAWSSPCAPVITSAIADWAGAYVTWCLAASVEAIDAAPTDSDTYQQVISVLAREPKGLTAADLYKQSRRLRAMKQGERDELIMQMVVDGAIIAHEPVAPARSMRYTARSVLRGTHDA